MTKGWVGSLLVHAGAATVVWASWVSRTPAPPISHSDLTIRVQPERPEPDPVHRFPNDALEEIAVPRSTPAPAEDPPPLPRPLDIAPPEPGPGFEPPLVPRTVRPLRTPLPRTESPPEKRTAIPRPAPAPVRAAVATGITRAAAPPPPAKRKVEYPSRARERGWEGVVTVQLRVDRNGAVRDAAVARSSGFRSLDRAAVAAVKNWVFEPALKDGRPVEARLRQRIEFRIR